MAYYVAFLKPIPQIIIEAEIINQPYSGEYIKQICASESVCNSQSWAYYQIHQ